MVDNKVLEIVDKVVDKPGKCGTVRVMRDDEDMVLGMTHAQYRAIARMVKRLREDRGDNHDALVDKRLEEEE